MGEVVSILTLSLCWPGYIDWPKHDNAVMASKKLVVTYLRVIEISWGVMWRFIY